LIVHESATFIGKAPKGAAMVDDCKPSLTLQMNVSESPEG
jgi:hypothetical protein